MQYHTYIFKPVNWCDVVSIRLDPNIIFMIRTKISCQNNILYWHIACVDAAIPRRGGVDCGSGASEEKGAGARGLWGHMGGGAEMRDYIFI